MSQINQLNTYHSFGIVLNDFLHEEKLNFFKTSPEI